MYSRTFKHISLSTVSLIIFTSACTVRYHKEEYASVSDTSMYFKRMPDDSPWVKKIRNWQQRSRNVASGKRVLPQDEESLYRKYRNFMAVLKGKIRLKREDRKQSIMTELTFFIQGVSKTNFLDDGAGDYWPTLSEVFERNGDDCDGLELLTFNALLEFGFNPKNVYRAVIFHKGDGTHHMVTFWFDDERREDPWVIDPNAASQQFLPVRMSEIEGWEPILHFNRERVYAVRAR